MCDECDECVMSVRGGEVVCDECGECEGRGSSVL